MTLRDVIIVGSGPAGLATAIAAKRAGLDHVVLEKGALVNTLFHFPTNMVYFTTPELLEIGGIPLVSPFPKPTRLEALRYYRRVVETYQLEIAYGERLTSVYVDEALSKGERILSAETRSTRGVRRAWHSRTVVLATGSFDQPNSINVPGEDLPHVSHYYTEAHAYYGKDVVIVGGKNSAAETALELYRSGARVTLVHRRPTLGEKIKYWVRPDIENRIKEKSVEGLFNTRVVEIRPTTVLLERDGERFERPADAVFLLTGHHPDMDLLASAGIEYDADTCVPCFNKDTLETNVSGLFLAGTLIAGREGGKVFIENGRFHGEVVIAAIRRYLGKTDPESQEEELVGKLTGSSEKDF